MTEKLTKVLMKNSKESIDRFNSYRDTFEKKKKRIKQDLEKAATLWKETSKKFKWWQSLP